MSFRLRKVGPRDVLLSSMISILKFSCGSAVRILIVFHFLQHIEKVLRGRLNQGLVIVDLVSSLVDLGSAFFSVAGRVVSAKAPRWHHDDAARVINAASAAALLGEQLTQGQIVLACLARVIHHHSIANIWTMFLLL